MFALSGCASSRDMLSRMQVWKKDDAKVADSTTPGKKTTASPLSKATTGSKREVAEKSVLTPRAKSTASAAPAARHDDEGIRRVSETDDEPPAERRGLQNSLFRRSTVKEDPFLKQETPATRTAAANTDTGAASRPRKSVDPTTRRELASAAPAETVGKRESPAETQAKVDQYKSLLDSLPKEDEMQAEATQAADTQSVARPAEEANPFDKSQPVAAAAPVEAARPVADVKQTAGNGSNPFAGPDYEELPPPDETASATDDPFGAAAPAKGEVVLAANDAGKPAVGASDAPAVAAKAPAVAEPDSATKKARYHADALMIRARIALKQDRGAALRLAEAAEIIEIENSLTYEPHEERPSDFVKRIKQLRLNETAAASAAAIPGNAPAISPGQSPMPQSSSPNPFAEEGSAASVVTPAEARTTIPAEETRGDMNAADDFYHYQPRNERPIEIRPNGIIENTSYETDAGAAPESDSAAGQSSDAPGQANVPRSLDVMDGPSFGMQQAVAAGGELPKVPHAGVEPGLSLPETPATDAVRYSNWAAAPAPWKSETAVEAKPAQSSLGTMLAVAVVALGLCGFGMWVRMQRRHYSAASLIVRASEP